MVTLPGGPCELERLRSDISPTLPPPSTLARADPGGGRSPPYCMGAALFPSDMPPPSEW